MEGDPKVYTACGYPRHVEFVITEPELKHNTLRRMVLEVDRVRNVNPRLFRIYLAGLGYALERAVYERPESLRFQRFARRVRGLINSRPSELDHDRWTIIKRFIERLDYNETVTRDDVTSSFARVTKAEQDLAVCRKINDLHSMLESIDAVTGFVPAELDAFIDAVHRIASLTEVYSDTYDDDLDALRRQFAALKNPDVE
jgi:hypothetical protein